MITFRLEEREQRSLRSQFLTPFIAVFIANKTAIKSNKTGKSVFIIAASYRGRRFE